MRLKNKNILIILVIGIMLIVSMFFTFNNKKEYKELPKVKLKEPLQNKQFALMLEQENGEYKESSDDFPTEGYVFNETKSGCTDLNGKKINDVLEYDYTNYSLTLNTNKTSYCYLYYDIEPNIKFFRSKDKDNHLTKELTGGLYRYQGIYEKDADGNVTNDVENYLCLGNDCGEFGEDLYRIIGINAKGELKVIKKTALPETYPWHTNKDNNVEWSDSDLFHRLNDYEDGTTYNNNSFYSTLNEKVKKYIIKTSWLYGDSTGVGNVNGDNMYAIETGKVLANRRIKNAEDGSIKDDQYLWKEKVDAYIGLQYFHDNFYTYPGGNPESISNLPKTWINIGNNDTQCNGYEWVMTRYSYSSNGGYYAGWRILSNGNIYGTLLTFPGAAIRPVFYLTSDLNLIGEGTLDEPFEIDYEKTGVDIINSKPANLSDGEVGGMHRFQGTYEDVNNNYICFETNDRDKCLNNPDTYMYRIIGILSNGEMKLIKQEYLDEKYPWHPDYTTKVEWPDSNIFKGINNEGFLNNENYLPKSDDINWSNKILSKNWYYGYIGESGSLTGEEIYEIETGNKEASWNEREDGVTTPSDGITCGVDSSTGVSKGQTRCYRTITDYWTDKVPAKIGLAYLHDIKLSIGDNQTCTVVSNCNKGWILKYKYSEESTSISHNYLITKNNYYVYWDAYRNLTISPSSPSGNAVISSNTMNVRPTFYIDSNTTYKGKGTLNYPYLVIK